jgi:hypothetical protein
MGRVSGDEDDMCREGGGITRKNSSGGRKHLLEPARR